MNNEINSFSDIYEILILNVIMTDFSDSLSKSSNKLIHGYMAWNTLKLVRNKFNTYSSRKQNSKTITNKQTLQFKHMTTN